jgi:hypothetical protein
VASCVDDLTLQSDLVKSTPPKSGWYRVLSDDSRLLNLVARQADPNRPLESVLDPLGELFGTKPQLGPGGMFRVTDEEGKSVAIAAPLPGERERPCELVTAPIDSGHQEHLERLLGLARDLGFSIPDEGATHLHFDGASLQHAQTFANIVQIFSRYGPALKEHFGVNPNCRRLGTWPAKLVEVVSEPGFGELAWEQVVGRLEEVKLTKYCDFNLVNLLVGRPEKTTLEVRILPVWMEVEPILEAAQFFESVLNLASGTAAVELPPGSDFDSLKSLLSDH